MKITFRQGIVSRQSGQFLQVVGDNVDLLAANRSATVTLAVRDTDYTHSEDNTVSSAWVGPFPVDSNPAKANAYLYWDFDPLTFERTFGWTTLPPAAQSVAPGTGNTAIIGVVPTAASPIAPGSFEVSGQYVLTTGKTIAVINSTGNDGTYTVQSATYSTTSGTTTIVVDGAITDTTIDGDINLDFDVYGQPLKQTGRTWYDTANHIHYELNIANQWIEVIRVFAARLNNATTFHSMSKDSDFTGSQIGDVSSVFAGRVLFGETDNPITRDDGTFFTTEDQFFTNQSRVDALRLESNVSRAKSVSGGTLSAFGIVAWVGDGEITTAQYDDVGSTVVGVLTENTNNGEVGAVIVQGTVTNPAWVWDSLIVGKPLWIENGVLVSTDPHISNPTTYLHSRVPVARVLSGDTVIFEQGLGGVGPQGPKGTITDIPLANNELVQGVVSLSHQPVNDLFPIAAGENHPVLTSGPYSVDGHGHAATEISFETIPGSITSTDVQNAIAELNTKKLSLTGGTMSGILTLSGTPVDSLDAVTKAYVDSLAQGIAAKEAAVVGTIANLGGTYLSTGGTGGTGNITGASISSLDGTFGTDYEVVVTSRVLVKDQTDDLQNGIYVVTALSAGSPPTTFALERSSDFDENSEIRAGSYVFIHAGLDQVGTGWVLTDAHPEDDIELNVHSITWTLISSATSFTADETTITIDLGNVISTKQADAGGTVNALKWNSQEFDLAAGSPLAIGDVITFNGTVWENAAPAAGGGGDAQTPWLSNIDTAGYNTFTANSVSGIGIDITTGTTSDQFSTTTFPTNNIHLSAGTGTGAFGATYGKGGRIILQPGAAPAKGIFDSQRNAHGMIEFRAPTGEDEIVIGTADSFTSTDPTKLRIRAGSYSGGTGNGQGGHLSLYAGHSSGSYAGGNTYIGSGDSAYSRGGDISITSGRGNTNSNATGEKDGGRLNLYGGDTKKRGHGGDVKIFGGDNTSYAYNNTASYGGGVRIGGGDSTALNNTNSGYGLSNVRLEGGNNTGVGSEGGNVTFNPGLGGSGGQNGEVWVRGANSYQSSNIGTLRLFVEDGSTKVPNSVTLRPPIGLATSVTFILPDTSGTVGEVLTSTGSGGTEWATTAGAGGALPSYEKIVIGGSPVDQILPTTVTVTSTAGSPIQSASIQVFRNGILQNEDTTFGGGIDGDFEVTGANELTFADDSLQPGGIIIIYVFS